MFSYISEYGLSELRGSDDPKTPRPWNLYQTIINTSSPERNLLDIGCGTAFKLKPLAPYFKEITGIDISESMVKAAKQTIERNKLSNVKIQQADSHNLPFDNHSFDVITCMLSRWSLKEIKRILKPNGILITEHIGCEDKKDFKLFFGKDQHGLRGQFIDYEREIYLDNCYQQFLKYFNSVEIKNGFWNTIYTKKGLTALLKFTPSIRNFDLEKDQTALETAIKACQTEKGITLTQNRMLIHAKNI